MNTSEIQRLIDTKIKGQGTNVDAGSALPPILTALNENVDKAVSPDSTEMTVDEQMQVRKNLGLYYEETLTERTEYDPDGQQVSGSPAFSEQYFIKASDTPINLDDLGTAMAVLQWGEETEIEITSDMIMDESAMGFYCVFQDGEQTGMPIVTVILEDSASPFGVTLTKGVWFYLSGDNHTLWVEHSATFVHKIPSKYLPEMPSEGDAVQYVPQELTDAQKMQARKNQDLYYSEQGQETTPLVTDQQAEGGYYKVSDDTPTKEEIIGIILYGSEPQPLSGFTVTDFTEGFSVSSSIFGLGMVLYSDYVSQGATLHPGIYLLASTYESFLAQFVYESGEVAHKIPEKYLPDMPSGIETVELLEMPRIDTPERIKIALFSASDWEKIDNNSICVVVYNGTPSRTFLLIRDNGYVFYGHNGVEFILEDTYAGSDDVYEYISNGKQIILSGLPTASMTSYDLGQLGLPLTFRPLIHCGCNSVVINDNSNPQVVGIVALTPNYLEFWTATDKYVITIESYSLSCTVTPR